MAAGDEFARVSSSPSQGEGRDEGSAIDEAQCAERFNAAVAAFDHANTEDPNTEVVGGESRPREYVYGLRMSRMLAEYAPDASEAVRLAVRCQHIRRWEIPRETFPRTREGYKAWRKTLADFHATKAAEILRAVGYPEATSARVAALLRKERLKSDPEAQLVEDVAALVFMRHYLMRFVAEHPEYDTAKFIDILARTARKMSPSGVDAALAILEGLPLPEEVITALRS